MGQIADRVKEFILREFLPDEDPEELTDTTPLIGEGILDSLSTLRVVTFLEESYGIKVEAHEADEENFGTVADIERLVESKL
jgi:acyl carrier protein